MSIPMISYLNEKGELSPEFSLTIPSEILLKGYRTMIVTRLVDDRMITLQRQGTITFAMSSKGEEACSVASAAALDFNDWIYPQYREDGVMFWRGCTIQQYVHHMFGDQQDWIFGRQMPNHFGSRKLNVVTVSSPIGTKIPHAVGCAYAMKYQKEANVAISYFGEGAASEGDFHAALNFAAVYKAPALFFCRNNGYAISTPISRQYAGESIAIRGKAYGISAYRIDGNDFFAVYETVKKAREGAIKGDGPVLIEAITYRLGAHSTSDDPSCYRQDSECEPWKEKDPIYRLRCYLERKKLWDEQQEKELVAQINHEITQAIETAKNTPRAPLKQIVEDVYNEVPETLKQEYQQLEKLFPNE